MADFKVDLDISALKKYLDEFQKELVQDIKKEVEGLAKGRYSHIVEEANKKLHSSRKLYLENLSPPEQIDDFTWVITLNEKAEWIETGRPEPYDMKPGLLKDGKTSIDGHKYRVVPMNQGKTPTEMSPNTAGYEQSMVDKVKAELKRQGIPYKKLELDKNGSPRHAGVDANGKGIPLKLHSLDIDSYTPGKGNTPQLKAINIYQTLMPDKKTVNRTITTFRTVTDNPNQKDKWIHPPVEGKEFFKEAKEFAENEWKNTILPKLMAKYEGK